MKETLEQYRRRKNLEKRRERWDRITEARTARKNARAAFWGPLVFWAIVVASAATIVLVLGGWVL